MCYYLPGLLACRVLMFVVLIADDCCLQFVFCFVGCVGCCRLCFVVLFCVLVVYFLLGYCG